MSVRSILQQSSSDLDTDQGDIIDEKIKQVAQSVNQILFKTSKGNTTSNLTQNDPPHMMDFQTDGKFSTQTQVTFIHRQAHSQLIPTDQPHTKKQHYTSSHKFWTSQTNHNEDRFMSSHSPTLCKQNSTRIKPQWVMQIYEYKSGILIWKFKQNI